MKYILTLLFIFGCFLSQAQLIPSSCTAPDSVLQLYRRDAQGLALDRIIRFNSSFSDSVLVPDEWTDSILRAMVAVYNVTSLPARDSVVKFYKVHSYHSQMALKGHNIAIDKTVPWLADVKAGIFPTRNDSVNKMMVRYGLYKYSFSEPAGDPYAYVYFRSDSSCNVQGLDSEWNKIYPMEVYASVYGEGSEIIVDTICSSYVQLSYRYSCGDCPSGCTVNRYWQFKVYNDCSVEYLGSKGSKVEGMDCIVVAVQPVEKPIVSVYPNPFSDELIIKGLEREATYVITNIVGQECLSGILNVRAEINTAALKAGVYFIKLHEGNNVQTIKLVKTE